MRITTYLLGYLAPTWASVVAGAFVLVTLVLSTYLVFEHLSAYKNPEEQKFLIGVILMVPCYAVESLVSLVNPSISIDIEILRDCYESFAMYCFGRYLVACLGGEERTIEFMEREGRASFKTPLLEHSSEKGTVKHPFPMNYLLKPWKLGQWFYQVIKIGIVQYMLIKSLSAILAVILEAFGVYCEGEFKWGCGWRKWMRHCVSTARFSVLVNGDSVGFFNSSRGLRQGDPLSPLLFVIVMEALSRMLSAAVEGGFLAGFVMGNINISHLLFADDTLLFCEAKAGHVQALKAILLCFEAVSGLKINLAKTEMVAVGEVRNIRGLANILGCGVSSLPLKYLGLPLGATFKAKAIWEGVLEILENKLAGWKRLYLTKGGRTTLIKSTLSNLPTYYLSLFPLPASIATKMEKLQRDFLWSGLGEELKFHLVGWHKVCTPLRDGGLGIRNVRAFNEALLGKWLWRYNKERGALWKEVIDMKYGSERGGWCSKESRGTYGVGLWKYIRKGWCTFASNTRLWVGNGRRVSFWNEVWVGDTVLKEVYPNIFIIARDKEAMVADLRVISNGAQEWNISLIRDAHDWEVTGMVEFLSLLYNTVINATSEDKIVWKPSRKGKFSVCSFYDTITMQRRYNFPWKNVWRSKAPKKFAFFVWTAALGKILTMDNLRRRGIIITEWCCMCRKNGETVDHLLLHCEFAREIWNFFFSRMDIAWVMPGRVIELIASWRGIAGTPQIAAVWKMAPLCILWCIWCERNDRLFEDQERSIEEFRRFFWKTLFMWAIALELNGLSFQDFLVSVARS